MTLQPAPIAETRARHATAGGNEDDRRNTSKLDRTLVSCRGATPRSRQGARA